MTCLTDVSLDPSTLRDTGAHVDRVTPRDVTDAARRDVVDASHDAALDVAPDAGVADDADEEADIVHPDDVPPFKGGVETLAGSGEPGYANGLRGDARFNNPVNVAVSPASDVYVADYENDAVRMVMPDGFVTTLLRRASFAKPFGMTFAPDGTLYVETDANDMGADNNTTGTVWSVAPGTRVPVVVARNVGRPRGLAVLGDGRLVMVDYAHHVVQTMDPATGVVTPLAGMLDVSGFADGTGAAARFDHPYGAALRSDGSIVVADRNNQRIRAITLGGVVTTIAGSGTAGHTDAVGADAQFDGPQGVAVDGADTLYVSELTGHWVRQITSDGTVTTIAGTGAAGFLDGTPLEAQFFGLEGIAISADGATLYLPDGNVGSDEPYHRMRRLQLH